MDFDPSAFLSMAMSEDQDAIYTAGLYWRSLGLGFGLIPPDIEGPCPSTDAPQGLITVEGGLEMEKDVQISIPTFDTLDVESSLMEGIEEDDSSTELQLNGDPLSSSSINGNQMDTITSGLSNAPSTQEQNISSVQPSPAERTSSPAGKKILTSYDEQRFRRDFYAGNFERVKLFRLHCTICDKHLGCAPWFTERQMRMHKLLSVCVCRKCFEYYGDINFPVEEGSEIYCCWCGEGGELFCCSKCTKAVCKKCFERNFGPGKVKEVEENDNWCCIVCNPFDIWPHRVIRWGMQRFAKEMRQKVALLSKDERKTILSKDTSHCCLNLNEECSPISFPPKWVLSKVPICLIATTHQIAMKNQTPTVPFTSKTPINQFRPVSTAIPFANTQVRHPSLLQPALERGLLPMHRSRAPVTVDQRFQPPNPVMPHYVCPTRQILYRTTVNRGSSHSLNRPVSMMKSQSTSQITPPTKIFTQFQTPLTRYLLNPTRISSPRPPEIIDLVEEPQVHQESTTPSSPNYDILWLERGIKKIDESLIPLNRLLGQFNSVSDDLKNDLSAIDSYFDKLSFAVKMAICNLAKVNQDMIDGKKNALDNTVSSVINEIQKSGILPSLVNGHQTPPSTSTPPPKPVLSVSVPPQVAPTTPSAPKTENAAPPSADEEGGYVNPALLCETVLEVNGNKENNHGNKVSKAPENVTPSKLSNQSKKRQRGRPKSKINNSIM